MFKLSVYKMYLLIILALLVAMLLQYYVMWLEIECNVECVVSGSTLIRYRAEP